MPHRRTLFASLIVSKRNRGSGRSGLPFLSTPRIRSNIGLVLEESRFVGTPAYSLAIQAEHLLQVIEGARSHPAAGATRRSRGPNVKWGAEGRAELLADPRTHAELAVVHGCSASAIAQQRYAAQREAAHAQV